MKRDFGRQLHHKCTVLLLLVLMCFLACTRQGPIKRYSLKGKVVSVDKQAGMLNVDSENIPGFMSAMIMPYEVRPQSKLDQLKAGDAITADVVVQGKKYWLENINITGTTTPAPASSTFHVPEPGEEVPNFRLVNQDGKSVSLRDYRGHALLVTFIYTRCPFPEYCPLLAHKFTEVHEQVRSNGRARLLSISFDPQHDTPAVLRAYGMKLVSTNGQGTFKTWEFVVPSKSDLPKIANFFGLAYSNDNGAFTHSLSTAVIGPDGRVFKWYHGSDWQTAEAVKDITAALQGPPASPAAL